MKINVTLIFSIVFSLGLMANPLDSLQEVNPIDNPEYIGYRLAITNISSELNEGTLTIKYTPINTGRKDLLFQEGTTSPPQLVVNFDGTLAKNNLLEYADLIKSEVVASELFVEKGSVSDVRSMKIKIPNSDVPVTVSEPIASTPPVPQLGALVPKSSEPDVKDVDGKEVKNDDFENSLATSSVKTEPSVGAKVDDIPEAVEYDENACSDLVFEHVKIVKKTKKHVTLQYTILNKGQGPAQLIHNRKRENLNMGFQAYLSSRDQMTRGSFTFDNGFVKNGLEESDGRLFPGERYTNTIKLNIQKMTKFTPYIILEMDPFLAVYECDKKNNKVAVKVGEGKGVND